MSATKDAGSDSEDYAAAATKAILEQYSYHAIEVPHRAWLENAITAVVLEAMEAQREACVTAYLSTPDSGTHDEVTAIVKAIAAAAVTVKPKEEGE